MNQSHHSLAADIFILLPSPPRNTEPQNHWAPSAPPCMWHPFLPGQRGQLLQPSGPLSPNFKPPFSTVRSISSPPSFLLDNALTFLSSQGGRMMYLKEQTLRPRYFLPPSQLLKFPEAALPI